MEARYFIQSLRLKGGSEWRKYSQGELREKGLKPEDIPAAPWNVYKDRGWTTMGEWLGTGTIAPRLRQYRPFVEARDFARSLKLKDRKQWTKYCDGLLRGYSDLPNDIPAAPWATYKDKG